MTPAGEAIFKERKGYGAATGGRGQVGTAESNDSFITCDPLGFPRDLLAHAVSSRGGVLFGSAASRILIAYEQQRVWREIWMDGRALPKTVDVRGARVDERAWLDEVGHPRSSSGHIQERYTRVDQYNLQLTVTVDDPKYYTKPWTWMRANWYWMKAQEFVETICVPSEGIQYRDTLARPSGIQIR